MAKTQTIKQFNSMLQDYIDKKAFVKIDRTILGKEEYLRGFILSMSRDFLLLQVSDDFLLDGYAIIRLDDFDSIRHSSYERTSRKIFKAEGLLEKVGIDDELPLTSWKDILRTLKQHDYHVTIQNFNRGYLDFWIGEIKRVTDKSVSILNYDPNGKLEGKPTNIKFDTISILTFGDRYSTTFRKYLKE